MGKPLTSYAREKAIAKLTKLCAGNEDPNSIVRQSIEENWQALFPVRRQTGPQTKADHQRRRTEEALRRGL